MVSLSLPTCNNNNNNNNGINDNNNNNNNDNVKTTCGRAFAIDKITITFIITYFEFYKSLVLSGLSLSKILCFMNMNYLLFLSFVAHNSLTEATFFFVVKSI